MSEKHTPFSDVFWLERYWIDQPSTLQPYHKWHGAHVLAYIEPGERYTTAYFTSGNIISTRIAVEALSKGWPNSEASAHNARARRALADLISAVYSHHGTSLCDSTALREAADRALRELDKLRSHDLKAVSE